jgi:hypothetical protein
MADKKTTKYVRFTFEPKTNGCSGTLSALTIAVENCDDALDAINTATTEARDIAGYGRKVSDVSVSDYR